jgi:hypothetical protein
MSILDVLEMENEVFTRFMPYIDILETRQRLYAMDANVYPKMSTSKQSEKQKELIRRGYPRELRQNEVLTTDQLEIELKKLGGLNGK